MTYNKQLIVKYSHVLGSTTPFFAQNDRRQAI